VEALGNPAELIASGHIDDQLSSTIAEDGATHAHPAAQVDPFI